LKIPLHLAGCPQTRVLENETLSRWVIPVVHSWFQGRSEQTLVRSSSPSTSSESKNRRRDRQLAHRNCLGDVQICCTQDAEEIQWRQLCYNYVCLSHSDLSGHFVVGFWSCPRNFYLRFLARNRPDDRFFGEKVRGEKIFSVHWI